MNNYEKLEKLAAQNGVEIVRWPFDNTRIKGLYCDNTIAINRAIETTNEKACVLAEELGHHETTAGNIIDQSDTANRKQEYKARLWSYNHLSGLCDIIRAYQHGCHSLYDMADRLDVTEEFLTEALQCYKSKYGTHTSIGNYVIYFEPSFGVCELR